MKTSQHINTQTDNSLYSHYIQTRTESGKDRQTIFNETDMRGQTAGERAVTPHAHERNTQTVGFISEHEHARIAALLMLETARQHRLRLLRQLACATTLLCNTTLPCNDKPRLGARVLTSLRLRCTHNAHVRLVERLTLAGLGEATTQLKRMM